MAFHPSKDWLVSNGLSAEKAGNVECFRARDYLQSRVLWGPGGLILHELSHAFHHKHCSKGFDCDLTKLAYDHACESGIYECIECHGSTPQRAYALTNHKEYFAELSVAYFCKDDSELNKWFPFNRNQLESHDPLGYDMCQLIWSRACCDE